MITSLQDHADREDARADARQERADAAHEPEAPASVQSGPLTDALRRSWPATTVSDDDRPF